jgi:hypothetical protein
MTSPIGGTRVPPSSRPICDRGCAPHFKHFPFAAAVVTSLSLPRSTETKPTYSGPEIDQPTILSLPTFTDFHCVTHFASNLPNP